MAIRNKSVAIRNPEFLNLSPLAVNRLMSKCDIKVLYTGKNRNGSHISKEVATKMADTLRGSPIVGYFRKDAGDFGDHGHRMTIDVDGYKEEVLTVPYGFVSTDAKVWFQVFEDEDEFGNKIEREYLVTEGYIWNGQFKEADKILKEGQPQSMEIDGESLDGHWANDSKTGRDFFIITDAEFSKLCILGDDVEPCFEGADIKASTSQNFSLVEENEDTTFKAQLLEMMKELKFALEGGHDMDNETKVTPVPVEATVVEDEVKTEMAEETPTSEVEVQTTETPAAEDFAEKKEASEFEDDGDEDDKDKKDDDDDSEPAPEPDDEDGVSKKKKPKKENSLSEEDTPSIEQEYAELKSKFDTLSAEYEALNKKCEDLTVFYNAEMNKQKDALIEKFYMLSDEDKKDVLENKQNYSLEEIESKLSVICFRKKVNFNLAEEDKNDNTMTDDVNKTFTLTMGEAVANLESDVPAWIKAIEEHRKNK